MISIEIKSESTNTSLQEIELFIDTEGIDVLMGQLSLLKACKTDHLHFMSDDWGGSELSSKPIGDGNAIIHHAKIYLV